VDGIHLKVRLEQDKVCLLVMIGVRTDGQKELIALADGFRESSESWADLLRDCKRRGMRAPVLAVGDGALGFWKAVRDVFPETREQRCWFHVAGINRPSELGQAGARGSPCRFRRRTWPWRLVMTWAWRAASECQPRVSASSRRARTSASWCWSAGRNWVVVTKLSHCSQMLA
jgi:hypothetical protein